MTGYNPNTYPYYQRDDEDYNSNDSPEEQAEMAASRQRYATQLLAAMHAAVDEVPVYVDRAVKDEPGERYTFACTECDWKQTLHVDELQANYEKLVAPCGCGWDRVVCVG